MSNGEHEIRTPKGLRIGNRSVVDKDRIGKSYNDYIAGHQMNLFEDFIGYQGSVVLDEPEQKTDTISVPIPQCEESENIPLPDFPEQPENVQRPGSEVVEKGILT